MSPDVLIVGGGHNGLTCAAYLARAGRSVVVLEQRPLVGGFCTSEETIATAPGFRFSPTSLDLMTANVPPSVIDELELKRHGLKLIDVDPFYSVLTPEGSSIAFYRDCRKTCSEIARISPRDAEAYGTLTEIMRDVWYVAMPYLMGHPTRPSWRTLWTMAVRAVVRRKNLARSIRILLSAPAPIVEELFETNELRCAFANLAAGGLGRLEDPLSGIIMATMALQHEWGVRRAEGGQSGLSDSLAASVKAHGGEIRCNSQVVTLLDDGTRITGVVTADGTEIRAPTVIAAVDPYTLYMKMSPPRLVPDQVQRELKNMGVFRNNIAPGRVDIALGSPLEYASGGSRSEMLRGSCVFLQEGLDYVRRAANNSADGVVGDEIPLWLGAPSKQDRSLVPAGSPGDALYVYLPTLPYALVDGRDWESIKPVLLEKIINLIEQYAPGTRANIVGTCIRSPTDMSRFSGVHRGHVFHVDMNMTQMGPWRPTPSLAKGSPIKGLLHTGAGYHPMGTVNGWSGRTTARSYLTRGEGMP